ncbi:MAG: 30S ribosomal protein S6 [Candidatus Bipolaricaulota bacterium]|nr:30S ribosomal protein S6 [Candidatus Bipolaricaulota bacterium]MCX7844606.1 30S ribosomal protein S6 [Candidatus Bipolaricaulota bacterium]MDW8152127.1 30S ribosomal protein S6 [Candidatus Bipolaricaulota bacterium]
MASEMRTYEVVYILRPDLEEAQRREKMKKVEALIAQEGGQVRSTEEWGQRILAYEIAHFREGYYVLVTFTLPADRVESFQQRLGMDDAFLRYQVVRVDGKT